MADGFFDSRPKIWPADRVERRSVASLLPYARNARTHSKEQIAQLAKLITAYGWTNPVLIDPAGELIAGHGRVLAAKALGLAEVPVMIAHGWSADAIKAYRLADNAAALQAGWDNELLTLELTELDASGFDMELTGFDPDWLEQQSAPDIDPNDAWDGMPEFVQPEQKTYHSMTVHFADADALAAFGQAIGQDVTSKPRFTWYPRQVRQKWADKRYATGELDDIG